MQSSNMSSQEADYERVLLVKPTVYVYKIPPLMSASRGFRASDWNLAEPNWTGRLRLVSRGDKLFLRIEDGTTGELYCQAPILSYPGPQIQPVADSRRYFVVKVVSDTGRSALIGTGFSDGADSFDLTVALQDHFSTLGKANDQKLDDASRPRLDLTLKGDIRVSLNLGNNSTRTGSESRPKPKSTELADPSKPFFLPPPPGSKRK